MHNVHANKLIFAVLYGRLIYITIDKMVTFLK